VNPLFDLRHPWPILAVVALHVAFFYALQAGLLRKIVEAPAMREVIATLIAPKTPKPPPPRIEAPKPRPIEKPIVRPAPPPPVPAYVAPVITTPSDTAIALPPPPPAPPAPPKFEPAAVSAPSAPAPVPVSAPPPIVPPRFDAAYLNNPPPAYPAAAKRMGDEGKVILRVHVDAQGRAQDVQLKTTSGSMRLDDAALATVREWRFVPARQGDEAVAAWVLVPIVFKLER
jgi:protein TonB